MAACGDVGCTIEKPEEAQTARDRVDYKKPVDEKKEEKVDDFKDDVKEEQNPILVQMLGESLIRRDENDRWVDVATTKLKETEVIALFFSAEYCPHCIKYKEILAKAYDNLKSLNKSFEIIFISHDRDLENFRKHYSDMDYLAMPYAARLKKGKLSRRFDIMEIPRLVMIDPKTGQATNRDAEQDVEDDEKFPWTNTRSILEVMDDVLVIDKTKEQVVFRDMRQRYTVLFICASSALCRRLLPTLKWWYDEFYDKLQDTDRSFEVLFVSSDGDEDAFEAAFEMMPWAAMSFKEQEKKKKLIKFLRLEAYPHIIVLDKQTNRVVTKEGRGELIREEELKNDDTAFPWRWSLFANLNEKPGFLNFNPCIIAWLQDKTDEEKNENIKMLANISKEYVESYCCRGFGFLYVTDLGESTTIPPFIDESDIASAFTLVDYDAHVKYSSDNLSVDELRSVIGKYNNESLDFTII